MRDGDIRPLETETRFRIADTRGSALEQVRDILSSLFLAVKDEYMVTVRQSFEWPPFYGWNIVDTA